MDRFRLATFDEAVELDIADELERHDHETCSFVVEITTGYYAEFIGMDGGEPEDQRLYRDWAWVVPALNKAYNDGLEAGHADSDELNKTQIECTP